jgi:hypothetical protein
LASVLYKRASRLFVDLAQARGEGRLPRLLTTLERTWSKGTRRTSVSEIW